MGKLTGGRGPSPVMGAGITIEKKNRPDIRERIPRSVLFHDEGPTGWGRIRRLGDYKGTRSETNFSDQHHKFTDPEEVA